MVMLKTYHRSWHLYFPVLAMASRGPPTPLLFLLSFSSLYSHPVQRTEYFRWLWRVKVYDILLWERKNSVDHTTWSRFLYKFVLNDLPKFNIFSNWDLVNKEIIKGKCLQRQRVFTYIFSPKIIAVNHYQNREQYGKWEVMTVEYVKRSIRCNEVFLLSLDMTLLRQSQE